MFSLSNLRSRINPYINIFKSHIFKSNNILIPIRNIASVPVDPYYARCVRENYKAIENQRKYGSTNYQPYPIILSKGRNCEVWTHDKQRKLDFLACYATVNQGHCHPRLIQTANDQMQNITLTSGIFHSDNLGIYQKRMHEIFRFDRLLPMNTGVEGAESAVKLARRWGYDIKKIPENSALIVFPNANYWGRSIAAISGSTDPTSYTGFGPYVEGFLNVEYNNLHALEELFKHNKNIAGYMFEPIQGEAGVIVPSDGYLQGVRELCNKYNVLMIADEVQTGLGRTGYLYACQYENVKPDILVLGKALSGGIMPISCVMASEEIMTVIKAGEHGSTFGGNPMANALALVGVDIILEEGLVNKSLENGDYLRKQLNVLKCQYPDYIKEVRGRGLMCAVEMNHDFLKKKNIGQYIEYGCKFKDVNDICWEIIKNGVLVKPTHDTIIRISPPLTVSTIEIDEAIDVINNAFKKI